MFGVNVDVDSYVVMLVGWCSLVVLILRLMVCVYVCRLVTWLIGIDCIVCGLVLN